MSDPVVSDPVASDPAGLARELARLARPTLFVFDCDGVLAPLVDHADDSVLLDDVGDLLASIAECSDDVTVAVLSGRSLDGLAQFGFVESIVVAGSYGGERRGQARPTLTDSERHRLAALGRIADHGALAAGDGAWVEHKPASVVLHVRKANHDAGLAALAEVEAAARLVDGTEIHHGSNVVELMACSYDKGAGINALRTASNAASVVYFGDDVPDEDAFAVLNVAGGDVSVKVGPGATVANRRLDDAAAVRSMLVALDRLVRS